MQSNQTVPSSPAVVFVHKIQTDQKLRTVQIQRDKAARISTTVSSNSTILTTPTAACYSSKFLRKTLPSSWNSSKKTSSTSSSPAGALGNKSSNNTLSQSNSNRNLDKNSRPSHDVHINFNNLGVWKGKRRRNGNYNLQTSALSTQLNNNSNQSEKINSERNQVGGGNSSARRIFTTEFKTSVVDAFTHDPECVGNQRATARKFRIHRRQVQKWIQQRPKPTPTIKVNSPDATRKAERIHLLENSGLKSFKSKSKKSSSMMANAINTLLSLRDAVRIKAPWSPQKPSSSPTMSAALNLGLLSNSASMLHDMDPSPPLLQSTNGPNGAMHSKHNSTSNSMPSRQDHRSPRISPQSATSISPSTRNPNQQNTNSNHTFTNLTNGHHLSDMEHLSTLSTHSEILDELSYIYPEEDFTLLRKACLKNEITLTKLSARLSYGGYPSTLTPSPSAPASRPNSNGNGNGNSGNISNLKDDYVTQQTLQLIKQQNEYFQSFGQHAGVSLSSFPSDMTMASSLNLGNLTDPSSSKYPSWFHPLAHAAAAAAAVGISLPAPATPVGGNTNGTAKKKASSDPHMFLSPKTPVSSSKPKTVAAALAASRHSPNIMGTIMGNGKSNGGKKPAAPRKRQQRPGKTSTITKPPVSLMDEDIDPTSMLEITATPPSEYAGMDLTTTASSSFRGNDSISTTAAVHSRRSLPLPNSKSETIPSSPYTTLSSNSSLIAPPQPHSPNQSSLTNLQLNSKSNGHNLLSAASLTLENYLRNVLPHKKSPPTSSFSNPSQTQNLPEPENIHQANITSTSINPQTLDPTPSAISTNLSESDKKKQQVLEAFLEDAEVAGDARRVARKFGLNCRVVSKWLKDGPSKSLPAIPAVSVAKPINGGLNLLMDPHSNPSILSMTDPLLHLSVKLAQQHEDSMSNGDGDSHHKVSTTTTGSFSSANMNLNLQKKNLPNKRKNTKPNQICDFQNDDLPDDSETVPLDMVVPIKKRRVSNSNNSS